MTVHMNIAKAKARLSELVALAESGEDVVISRGGKPVVRLNPVTPPAPSGPRVLGFWSHLGEMRDPDLFLQPDAKLEADVGTPVDPEP